MSNPREDNEYVAAVFWWGMFCGVILGLGVVALALHMRG